MNEETKGPEAPTAEKLFPLREISKEALAKILEAHRKWVESEGKEGVKADLSRANLQEADLVGANLQEANLSYANLQGANLPGGANLKGADFLGANLKGARLSGATLHKTLLLRANLDDANLIGADLSGANLTEAQLQGARLFAVKGLAEATLQNANLEGATGLLGTEFARADVTGAKLPEGIREFKLLETVAETSKNARKIFLWMLLGCAYSWLTIATTTDARLLTNSVSSPLPIIRTEIPIAWFYWAAPFALVVVYIYLHFYLRMLWEGLAGLPAIFPDGKRLDQRAYPWLLNGLVRRHFERLRKGRSLLVRLEEGTTTFLAWWSVPLTLFGFWLRHLRRHEWVGTGLQVGVLVASVALGIMFYRSAARTLRGTDPPPLAWTPLGWKTFWRDRRTYQVAGTTLLGVLLSVLSFGAIEGVLGVGPYRADLVEAELSIKPDNWTGIGDKDELNAQIAQVKKARLLGMNLRYASAEGAFLVKADLDKADLRMAGLFGANLQGADLFSANLQGADLLYANLRGAYFVYANLQGADLENANLQEADLSDANLQGANLENANLQEANFGGANLQGANLIGANLQGANLGSANLQGAYLIQTEGLTQEQLDLACGDGKTGLPPDMSVKPCPQQEAVEARD